MAPLKRRSTPPGPITALFDRLHELHLHAGEPSVRQIATGIGGRGVISYTTVHNVLCGPQVPRWGYLELVVEQLGGDIDQFRALWKATRRPSLTPKPFTLDSVSVAPGGDGIPPVVERQIDRTEHAEVTNDQWIPVGEPLTGHTKGVMAVAFAPPDGTLLATASRDQTVWLWDSTTSKPVAAPFITHYSDIVDLAFSPDGRLLATASDHRGRVSLYDMATGDPIYGSLSGDAAVAFSPDGRFLATGSSYYATDNSDGYPNEISEHTVRLWDTATGAPINDPLAGHTSLIQAVAFSPDGHLVAAAGWDHTVWWWNVSTGVSRNSGRRGHADPVMAVAFSPDGQLLATASHDRTVRLWNPTTGKRIGDPLIGHTGAILDLAFSPDGHLLATASNDKTVRLWNLTIQASNGRPLTGYTSTVSAVAFSPNGCLLATGSSDGTVRLWRCDR